MIKSGESLESVVDNLIIGKKIKNINAPQDVTSSFSSEGRGGDHSGTRQNTSGTRTRERSNNKSGISQNWGTSNTKSAIRNTSMTRTVGVTKTSVKQTDTSYRGRGNSYTNTMTPPN